MGNEELLPCPFCGTALDLRGGAMFHPELDGDADCPLTGLSWAESYYRPLWNTRALTKAEDMGEES